MNSAKLNDWLQVVGIFALVGSLIFVGLQMRQTQKIALSQAYQARADQGIAMSLAAAESDTTLKLWAKERGLLEGELTPEERALALHFVRAQLQHWENIHYQYQQGFVTEEHWQTQLAMMRVLMPLPAFRDTYENTKEFWRASFGHVLEQMY